MTRTPFTLAAALCAVLSAATASAEVIGADAAACRSGHGPAIQVNIAGLKDRTGEIWLELYPNSEADFLRDDTDLMKEGKTFRRTRGRLPASGDTAICVRVPRAGRYALLVRHNRTGKDTFSFWTDGVGFPSNRAIGRSRPKFAQALIDAGAGVTTADIRMQYLHGLRGFAPS